MIPGELNKFKNKLKLDQYPKGWDLLSVNFPHGKTVLPVISPSFAKWVGFLL